MSPAGPTKRPPRLPFWLPQWPTRNLGSTQERHQPNSWYSEMNCLNCTYGSTVMQLSSQCGPSMRPTEADASGSISVGHSLLPASLPPLNLPLLPYPGLEKEERDRAKAWEGWQCGNGLEQRFSPWAVHGPPVGSHPIFGGSQILMRHNLY